MCQNIFTSIFQLIVRYNPLVFAIKIITQTIAKQTKQNSTTQLHPTSGIWIFWCGSPELKKLEFSIKRNFRIRIRVIISCTKKFLEMIRRLNCLDPEKKMLVFRMTEIGSSADHSTKDPRIVGIFPYIIIAAN